MNALFICSKNKLRSPTAENVARTLGIEADSAGLSNESVQLLEPEQIAWADTIFVMEIKHKAKLNQKYSQHLKNKKIIVLGIPDDYEYMQPELIDILNKKLPQFITAKIKHKLR